MSEGREEILLIINWANLMAHAHNIAAMITFQILLKSKLEAFSGLVGSRFKLYQRRKLQA